MLKTTVKYIEAINLAVPLDDRDAWPNKRIEDVGKLVDHLTSVEWFNIIKELLHPRRIRKRILTVEDWPRQITDIINDHIMKVFSSDNWGSAHSKHKKQGVIVDRLKETLPLLYTEITNIKPPLNKRNPHAPISTRTVQPTQVGFVDIVYSPEDEQVGLKKALAQTMSVSIEQPEEKIYIQVLRDFKDLQVEKEGTGVYLTINDKRIGMYTSITDLRNRFREYRELELGMLINPNKSLMVTEPVKTSLVFIAIAAAYLDHLHN